MTELKKSLAWRMSVCALGVLLAAARLPEAKAETRQQSMEHANGVKKMLVVRVEPKGKPGKPISEAAIRAAIKEANTFFAANSGGKLSFVVTVPPVVPVKNVYYDKEVLEAVEAASIDISKYDLTVWIGDDGKGSGLWGTWKKGEWLSTSIVVWGFTPGSIAFWMAQTGLDVEGAHGWLSSNENPIGEGRPVSQRNHFDAFSIQRGHYGTRVKNYLGWLADSDVETITKSGIYRVAAHDQPNSTGTRALKIAKDGDKNYWIELRQGFPKNPWATNGALVMWGFNRDAQTMLLDMTPGSIGEAEASLLGNDEDCGCMDVTDAPLVIGRTFSDREAGIHITTLRKVTVNGSDGKPLKALDIMVNLGQFPDNHPPKLSLKASAQSVKAEQPVTFKATADDADGDKISYYWDFGDLGFHGGDAVTSHAWVEDREYVVRCTASDGKGGTASSSLVVKVGAPKTTRIEGRVLLDGKPLADAVVRVVPETPATPAGTSASEEGEESPSSLINRAFTDSDGTYTLVDLPSQKVRIEASREGYAISDMSTHAAGPVEIVASKGAHLDFTAVRAPVVPKAPPPAVVAPAVPVPLNVPMTPPATNSAVPGATVPGVVAPAPAVPAKTRARAMPVLPDIPAVAVPGEEEVKLIASIDRPRIGAKGLPPLSGLGASLPEGRVKGVEVSIQRLSDSFYWNGKTWSAEKKGLPAVLADKKWTLARGLPAATDLSKGETYTIAATAIGANGERSLGSDVAGEPPLLLDSQTSGIIAPQVAGLASDNAPHTIEMWVRATAFPESGRSAGLMRFGNQDSGSSWLIYAWQGTGTKASLQTVATGQAPDIDMPLDEWIHLASAFDGKNWTMCVNGKPVQTLHFDWPPYHLQKSRLLVGLTSDDPATPFPRFKGGIGQVRVWNRARTPQEIERDMHERMTGTEDGLILLWRMEEGRGNVLHDSSGRGNDGQIIGGSTWARVSSVQITLDPAKP